jgi:DNA-binding beta-propeller fold protein YncE
VSNEILRHVVRTIFLTFVVFPAAAGFALAEEPIDPQKRAPAVLPGMQAGGNILLPNQWSLRPAGKQLKVGDFPVHIALHPRELFAAVLHAGYGDHEVVIVELKEFKIVSRVNIPETFVGLAFNPDGSQLFASGAEDEVVHQFAFAKGFLSDHRQIRIADAKEKFVPAGLSLSKDGKQLYVANPWGDTVALVPLEEPAKIRHIKLTESDYPYTTLSSTDGLRLYVSLWGRSSVAVINLETKKVDAVWEVKAHPTELLLNQKQDLLFVACANSNSVCVLETATGKTLEVITSSLYPQAPVGSTPNSIALSPDEKVLLIANADNNNVAVIDVSERGHSRSLGFIPAGWYPTSVRFSPQDGKIYIANGKGLMSKANSRGPNPAASPPRAVEEYIGGLFRGTVSQLEPPTPRQMARLTKDAFACSPLRADQAPVSQPRDAGNPIPATVGGKSPIKHCIYIIKENRTYDQVFGDMPEGNGDKSLCIFPEKVTPNHHALARQFVLLDNFYVESEVSADGHEWSMAAYATDFVEKTWPLMYRGSRGGKLKYPSEGNFTIAASAGGYIWDRCAQAKVSYRSYGEFIANAEKPGQPAKAKVKPLEGHFDEQFHGYDLDYPDQKRADRFIEELARFEKEGEMPQFIVMRLPNDHTYGTSPDKPTPTAMVADNDLALGRVIEALSQSKFWKDTAVFVVEDDAQNGSDHVDAHRTVAFVISPYTRRGIVDSSLYSTSSMLRTMELILGLEPMTQFDASALPMYNSFQVKADLTPYRHLPSNVDLGAKNASTAYGAAMSLAFDFSQEDAADDLLLNEVVWRSVRGPNSPMPAPVRAGFVFGVPEEESEIRSPKSE